VSIALATLGFRFGHNLPVLLERMAFGQGCDEHGAESNDQKDPDGAKTEFVTFLPVPFRHALKKFGDGELGHPDAACKLA
jgi:hypothetical protein